MQDLGLSDRQLPLKRAALYVISVCDTPALYAMSGFRTEGVSSTLQTRSGRRRREEGPLGNISMVISMRGLERDSAQGTIAHPGWHGSPHGLRCFKTAVPQWQKPQEGPLKRKIVAMLPRRGILIRFGRSDLTACQHLPNSLPLCVPICTHDIRPHQRAGWRSQNKAGHYPIQEARKEEQSAALRRGCFAFQAHIPIKADPPVGRRRRRQSFPMQNF